jgi:preprotein translocase subunit YajC
MGHPRSSLGSLLLALGMLAMLGQAQEETVGVPTASATGSESPTGVSVTETGKSELDQSAAPGTSRGFWVDWFSNPVSFLLLSMVVIYLLLIVPGFRANKKTQREQEERLASLKKNDRVVTSFGVHGVVSGIHNESGTVTIRIDENTNAKLTVNRETIRVVRKD